jgi:hypothetical protein
LKIRTLLPELKNLLDDRGDEYRLATFHVRRAKRAG